MLKILYGSYIVCGMIPKCDSPNATLISGRRYSTFPTGKEANQELIKGIQRSKNGNMMV